MTGWPAAPAEAAFHGPAGEFVLRTEPHSEAHPMALLAQFLVAFGTACGRGAYYQVEADRHYPNEFCILVGPSAKGRKGSSWGHVRRALAEADPAFVDGCLASGLSSGEGLIAQVRDTIDETDADAPADKRRLVLEQEFAQVLKVLSREGNTLSPIVRQAWDGDALQTMVRNNPLRASAAHIGIIGHITKDELLRYLTATELANGFFNRFLLVAVDRSKLLPFGSALDANELARVRDAVRLALRFADAHRALPLDPAARERWIDIYTHLSAGQPGLAGAATARAEAHVVRLALIYALLDYSDTIGLEHLEAALAIWRYSADSSSWIFGDSLGDPTADEIWTATKERPAGVTRTDVSEMFSRNKKRREIERALSVLEDAGRLRRETRHPEHGRTAEIWIPVLAPAA
ncbi:MAG: DUF3987 domain-containing protein [Solirubrobacteraceae bacterium]|jgi:hypothetical protein